MSGSAASGRENDVLRIARRIALRFHDSPAEPPLRQFADDDLADEKPRKFQRVAGQFFSSEAANLERRAFHGLRRAYVGRFVVKKPRQLCVINDHGGVLLNGVKILLLKRVARFRRRKYFPGKRDGGADIFRRDGIFAGKSFVEANDKFGNIVKPTKLRIVDDQPEEFSDGHFSVGAFILAALHIQQSFVKTEQREAERNKLLAGPCFAAPCCG